MTDSDVESGVSGRWPETDEDWPEIPEIVKIHQPGSIKQMVSEKYIQNSRRQTVGGEAHSLRLSRRR